MPWAVIIPAVATVASSVIQSRAANKATKASQQANREALDYTKEQEATRKAQYDKAMASYERQMDAYNATRSGLLSRYGVNVAMPTSAPPGPTTTAASGFARGSGLDLRDPRNVARLQAAGVQEKTIADILGRGANPGEWNNWERYGLRQA